MQLLSLISDILLICATIGLAAWCRLLSIRLRAVDDVDQGIGGTIAALALRVDDLKASVASTMVETSARGERLAAANAMADDRIGRMEMLLASLEDLEEEGADRLLRDSVPAGGAESVPSFRASRSPVAGGRS